MFYQVIVQPKYNPQLRMVEVDDRIVNDSEREDSILEWIYRNGQNDFQPRNCPSVSMGDIILLDGKFYIVEMVGFSEMNAIGPVGRN